jgi:hypothetical protein
LLIHRLVAGLWKAKDRDQFLKNAATALGVAELTKHNKDKILLAYHKNDTYNEYGWKSATTEAAERRGGAKRPRRGRHSTEPQPDADQPMNATDAEQPMYVTAPAIQAVAGPEAWLEWKPSTAADPSAESLWEQFCADGNPEDLLINPAYIKPNFDNAVAVDA